jgi:hypothetical protein
MASKRFASSIQPVLGKKQRPIRRSVRPELVLLEDRCLPSGVVSIPPNQIPPDQIANHTADLNTIFWNGGAPINTVSGLPKQAPYFMSPDGEGAGKTFTMTNYGPDTIYPFLRSANTGQDPHSSNFVKDVSGWYDPQDLNAGEFREYVGYSLNGTQYLGLPSGATITFEVPLVLWDGDNISIATDDTYLTTPKGQPGATLFGYDTAAKIAIATKGQSVNGSTWVKDTSSNYPSGESPLVMFYYADTAATVADDAPSQPAEATFRDPYLTKFIDDAFQTFALINYDVTDVNKLAAPGAVEASNVPITAGSVKDNNLTYYSDTGAHVGNTPNFDLTAYSEDFGWNGSNKDLNAFDTPLQQFVSTGGSLGAYFAHKVNGTTVNEGWPTFYNPNSADINIPSGSDVFDLSPLDVHGNVVHTSNFDINRWILSTSGGGAIQASASSDGPPTVKNGLYAIPLSLGVKERPIFVADIASMKKTKQTINLVVSTDLKTVLGTLDHYDPSASVLSISLDKDKGGSNYSDQTYVKIVPANGGPGEVVTLPPLGPNYIKGGVIQAVNFVTSEGGSGYITPPIVEFIDPTKSGSGAKATAVIGGGTAYVKVADGQTLPTGSVTWVFKRNATDYATTATTNLWYSWANYYVGQFTKPPPDPTMGQMLHLDPNNPSQPGATLSNEIKLDSIPSNPDNEALAVGMGVTAPAGIPDGTTIIKIVGNIIYLSQVPTSDPGSQLYTFTNPTKLPIDATSAKYTTPYTLSFDAAATPNAKLFAGSVYAAMSAEALRLQLTPKDQSAYLPLTMDIVANVIKFNANLPTHDAAWGSIMVGEVRDLVKSILRGVYDYFAIPDQSKWYPDPAAYKELGLTSGQKFNVFNLDPYVWFVHKVEGLTGYAFSVDDDVANPAASGGGINTVTHFPSNVQFGFAGIKGTGKLSFATPLTNQQEWFPTTKWGEIKTMATIGVWNASEHGNTDPDHNGYSYITLQATKDDPNVLRTLNKIITPGPGQVGAYILAPGYIVPGTTLIFFPAGVLDATKAYIILSQPAISTNGSSIPITIDAAQMKIPRVPVQNPNFEKPIQSAPNFYTTDPPFDTSGWNFTGSAGIAAIGSKYTKNNPPPVGTQVAFISDQGSISQSVNLAAGQLYAVSFVVAERLLDNGNIDAQTLEVRLDNNVVIGDFKPVAKNGSSYVEFFSKAFKVNVAGPHTITIVGTGPKGGDNTALIDEVTVTGPPGPVSLSAGDVLAGGSPLRFFIG